MTRRRLFLVISCASALSACSDGVAGPHVDGAYDHARAPGASASDLLAADDFDRVVVQVQYVQGFRPSDEGLQHLEDFLTARLDKPGGIVIEVDAPLQIQSQASYTVADVRAIERQHRTAYTEGSTIAVYMLFLNGELSGESTVLGIAYNNTSMAIFEEKIAQHTGGALEPSQEIVEGTVANHEIGHILGLVNIGSSMQVEHQDEPNGSHCDDPDCLMYYTVRTTDFLANLVGRNVPVLDQDCIDDLRANGGR